MNVNDLSRMIKDTVKPLHNRVMLMVGRGIILSSDDSKAIQTTQITLLADEVKDGVESFGQYGFTSNPPEKTECIMVSVAGSRDNGVIIATENRLYRKKDVAKGDSAQYNKNGKYVWLKGNNLEINTEKVKFQNASHEMVAVLSEFMDEVIKGLTITAIGPQPWEPATKQKLLDVKAKLDTFKV